MTLSWQSNLETGPIANRFIIDSKYIITWTYSLIMKFDSKHLQLLKFDTKNLQIFLWTTNHARRYELQISCDFLISESMIKYLSLKSTASNTQIMTKSLQDIFYKTVHAFPMARVTSLWKDSCQFTPNLISLPYLFTTFFFSS